MATHISTYNLNYFFSILAMIETGNLEVHIGVLWIIFVNGKHKYFFIRIISRLIYAILITSDVVIYI